MALGILGGIASIVMEGPTGEKPRWISLCGIDMLKPTLGAPALPERAIQWWPDTISDTIEVGWNFTDIPGASHALGQWGSNGGRTISFTVVLSRDMKPMDNRTAMETILDPFGMTKPEDDPERNANVAGGIRYLRAFTQPYYRANAGTGGIEAYPPPICLVHAPNFGWSEQNTDVLVTVMTGCDVTYQLCFPDGTPRLAEVSLTLRQIVQLPGKGQRYTGRQSMDMAGVRSYQFTDKTWNGAGHDLKDTIMHDGEL
jgi:hypothetical protein